MLFRSVRADPRLLAQLQEVLDHARAAQRVHLLHTHLREEGRTLGVGQKKPPARLADRLQHLQDLVVIAEVVHRQVQLLQRNITIIKQRIVDKDRVISGQFKSQHVDSRRELEQLKQTKQKIGYYSSSVVGRTTGQSLNKNL